MAVTFRVAEVEIAREPLPTVPAATAVQALLQGRPEANTSFGPLVGGVDHHALLSAVHFAFDRHYPLVLTPDAIWLAIAQGFAQHVEANAEALRPLFVTHDAKETISIRRDDFIKGSPENPWPEVFSAFSDQLGQRIGKKRDLLVSNFSTTGVNERAASEIVLMGAMKQYFTYEMISLCGIPSITLEGTAADYRSIRTRAENLAEFGCKPWLDGLLPVLDQIVRAADGHADVAFFQSFYKRHQASGHPHVSGWINALFPYVKQYTKDGETWSELNPFVHRWAERFGQPFDGPDTEAFPSGCSKVEFEWKWPLHGVSVPMHFAGGFLGVAQDAESLAVRPVIGWAILDRTGGAQALEASAPASASVAPGGCPTCGARRADPTKPFCVSCGAKLA